MSRKLSCLPCDRCGQGCGDVQLGDELVCRSCANAAAP